MSKKTLKTAATLIGVKLKAVGAEERKVLDVLLQIPYSDTNATMVMSNLKNTMVLDLKQQQGDLNDFVDPKDGAQTSLPNMPPSRKKTAKKAPAKKASKKKVAKKKTTKRG